MEDSNYKIPLHEMFVSLEGEGPDVGTPTLFIRVAGCNFKCPFCDTKDSWEPLSTTPLEKVVSIAYSMLDSNQCVGRVSITGGNPALYKSQVIELIKELARHKNVRYINLEHPGIHPKDLKDTAYQAEAVFIKNIILGLKYLHLENKDYTSTCFTLSMDAKYPLWVEGDVSAVKARHHCYLLRCNKMEFLTSAKDKVHASASLKVLISSLEDLRNFLETEEMLVEGTERLNITWWVALVRGADNLIDEEVLEEVSRALKCSVRHLVWRLNPNLHVQLGLK